MKKQRKHYTPEEKVAILRRHLVEECRSRICVTNGGSSRRLFYRWQKEFFENGAAAFQQRGRTQPSGRTGTNRVSGEEDPDEG